MAGAQFSQQWWNDEALARGNRLTRADIQALTGMVFGTSWNPDGTVAFYWYKDVENRAPGFKSAGLVLNPGTQPAGFDVMTVVGSPDYPAWPWFQSAVGFVAPGTTTPYTPTLSTAAPPPTTATAPIPSAPTPPSTVTSPPSTSLPVPPSTVQSPTVNIQGQIPPAPSSPFGSSPSTLGGAPNPTTVALTNASPSTNVGIESVSGATDIETTIERTGSGFPFLPNVPKLVVVGVGILAVLLLFSERR